MFVYNLTAVCWTCGSSYSSNFAYGQSKLANILHAKELAQHLKVSLTKSQKLEVTHGRIMTGKLSQKGSVSDVWTILYVISTS